MGLPKIDLPLFEAELPSSGKKFKYRPFTVKEEKILLVAQESNETTQEILSVKQVVNNCLIDMDIEELAMFDLEFVMLLLRARSVDNEIKFSITDPDTDESIELLLDVEEVKLTKDEAHTNQVKINDVYTLILKYPTIDDYIKTQQMDPTDPLINYVMMLNCLDQLVSDDEVHNFKDYQDEEIDGFVETFSGEVVKGIQNFFTTIPKLRHELKYVNKDGTPKTFVIEGMKSFFS
jgi:hypothetical protein